MEFKDTQSQLPICKIKYGTWKNFQSIGSLPLTFADFIKIISTVVFPFDFSIFYMNEEYTMIPIASSTAYKYLLKYTLRNENIKEVKIIIVLQLQDNEKDKDKDSHVNRKRCELKSQKDAENVYSNDENTSEENDMAGEKPIRKLIIRRDNRLRTKKKQPKKTNGGINSVCIQCY